MSNTYLKYSASRWPEISLLTMLIELLGAN